MSRTCIEISVESVHSPDASRLIALLSADLALRYAEFGDDGTAFFSPDDLTAPGGAFFIARRTVNTGSREAVGCAAIRPLLPGIGEIKRMFVLPESRCTGIARLLIETMETWARDWGYEMLRLETGARQPEAIVLYERNGYVPTAPFGEYADYPLANFYEKRLKP